MTGKDHPRTVWKAKIGRGYAPISVKGKYLYTLGYERGRTVSWGLDSVYCLERGHGRALLDVQLSLFFDRIRESWLNRWSTATGSIRSATTASSIACMCSTAKYSGLLT